MNLCHHPNLFHCAMTPIAGEHVLDEVSEVCYLSLKSLKIVNITRTPLSMMAVSSFANLRCLTISPHNLGDDLVESMGKSSPSPHLVTSQSLSLYAKVEESPNCLQRLQRVCANTSGLQSLETMSQNSSATESPSGH